MNTYLDNDPLAWARHCAVEVAKWGGELVEREVYFTRTGCRLKELVLLTRRDAFLSRSRKIIITLLNTFRF